MANPSEKVKLLINKQTKQVLFAEAGKEFVDFLFFILSLPLATVISLVGKQGLVGSLANLYESVENLNENYMQPNQPKSTILKPDFLVTNAGSFSFLLAIKPESAQKMLYGCTNDSCTDPVSDGPNATCPCCKTKMTCEMSYVAPAEEQQASSEGGYVKGVITYMVMDDLVVKPVSAISIINLLSKFNVEDIGAVEETVVDFGMDEALKLLKASMETKNVLRVSFAKLQTDYQLLV